MRTVLTMTTSPQRMKHLHVVLDSLFNQIAPPHRGEYSKSTVITSVLSF